MSTVSPRPSPCKENPGRPTKPLGWPVGLQHLGSTDKPVDFGNPFRFLNIGGAAVPLSLTGGEVNDLVGQSSEIMMLEEAAETFGETVENMRSLWIDRWGSQLPNLTGPTPVPLAWYEALHDDRVARRIAFITPNLGRFDPADVLTAALDNWNALNEEAKFTALGCAMSFDGEPQWNFDADDAAAAKGGAL